jgi:hypothetical protein
MPTGWSFNWENMARWEARTQTRSVKSLLVVSLYVLSVSGLSLIVARGNYDVVPSQEQGHYMEKGEVLTLAGESGDCHQREG